MMNDHDGGPNDSAQNVDLKEKKSVLFNRLVSSRFLPVIILVVAMLVWVLFLNSRVGRLSSMVSELEDSAMSKDKVIVNLKETSITYQSKIIELEQALSSKEAENHNLSMQMEQMYGLQAETMAGLSRMKGVFEHKQKSLSVISQERDWFRVQLAQRTRRFNELKSAVMQMFQVLEKIEHDARKDTGDSSVSLGTIVIQ